jgi:hypothetical protein
MQEQNLTTGAEEEKMEKRHTTASSSSSLSLFALGKIFSLFGLSLSLKNAKRGKKANQGW